MRIIHASRLNNTGHGNIFREISFSVKICTAKLIFKGKKMIF